MASEASNKIKYLLATKAIDFDNDAFKLVLMDSTFTFNKDSHDFYSDIIGSEHANGSGYTVGGETLSLVGSVVESEANDRAEVTWSDKSITSVGAQLSSNGACIIDTTAGSSPVVGFIDFGSTQTVAVGGVLTIANITVNIT